MSKLVKNRYPVLPMLKGAIRAKGYTYRELAALVGLSHNSLSNKLNGHMVFDTEESAKIGKVLGINNRRAFLEAFYPGYDFQD